MAKLLAACANLAVGMEDAIHCTARSKPAGHHAVKRQLKTLESGMAKRSNPAANHGANWHLITA
jgi:hypothetical protein